MTLLEWLAIGVAGAILVLVLIWPIISRKAIGAVAKRLERRR